MQGWRLLWKIIAPLMRWLPLPLKLKGLQGATDSRKSAVRTVVKSKLKMMGRASGAELVYRTAQIYLKNLDDRNVSSLFSKRDPLLK